EGDTAAFEQLVIDQSGSLSNLSWTQVQRQPLGDHEVELRVLATGLNFRDVLVAMGQYPDEAPLGCECVGEIIAVGSMVTDCAVGQRVMAIAPRSFAERVTVNRKLVVPVPGQLTNEAAATLPVAFTTAYYSLCQLAQLKAGERVLIHSAAGGVGQAAVQIAKQAGAEIFATASPSKWETLRSLGISHIMNSRTLAFSDEILSITEGQGVDVVLNALPGEFRAKSLDTLGQQGRFVDIGKGDGLTPEQITQQYPELKHFTVDLSQLCEQAPQQVQTLLQHLSQQVEGGQWQPLPLTTYPQTETLQAFRRLQQAKTPGKIVVLQPDSKNNRPTNNKKIAIDAEGSYLVTGGFGGLGLVMAQWLAEHGAKHIVLLGRGTPSNDAQAQIKTLQAENVHIDVVMADVTDSTAMTQAISAVSPPLRGIIHGAGTLDDSLLQAMSADQLEKVLAPKVTGAWILHHLTRSLQLDFFILFSSAAGLLGSPGQANHATANAFLDGLARYRQQLNLPAISLDWGAWSTVGSALKYQHQGSLKSLSGVGLIALEQGLAQLEAIWQSATLTTDNPQIGIVPIDWSAFLSQPAFSQQPLFKSVASQQPAARDAVIGRETTPQVSFIQTLENTPQAQKREVLESFVCRQICQILGFSPDELDMEAGFFDLGMDSLTALELKNSLETAVGLSLPSTLAFDYPTVEALIAYLSTQLIEPASQPLGQSENQLENQLGEKAEMQQLDSANAYLSENDLNQQMDQKLAELDELLSDGSPTLDQTGGEP
ncbi:MAG: SDR family NAD(P)-dependent oxidoreductase, partial [Cyanobacteria bacterium J06607_10]